MLHQIQSFVGQIFKYGGDLERSQWTIVLLVALVIGAICMWGRSSERAI